MLTLFILSLIEIFDPKLHHCSLIHLIEYRLTVSVSHVFTSVNLSVLGGVVNKMSRKGGFIWSGILKGKMSGLRGQIHQRLKQSPERAALLLKHVIRGDI